MDIATLIGLVLALVSVIFSITMAAPLSAFIDIPSLCIVLGGTVASGLISFDMKDPKFFELGDVNLIEVQSKPLSGWSPWQKAVIDYGLGTVFYVLLLPLFLLISCATKLDSRGPIFFRQRRHGFNNQEIEVIKFRTMFAQDNDEDAGVPQATRNDRRVTRVGRFLRATSLDEIPQLINVMRGEMSLTGPRPHAVEHNFEYDAKI